MPMNTSQDDAELVHSHRRVLTRAALLARTWSLLLAILATNLPLFDTSPLLLSQESGGGILSRALSRWDVFHFAHIARDGYTYEHDWAFMPGIPGVMRVFGAIIRVAKDTALGHRTRDTLIGWEDVVQGGLLAALACDSSGVMYELSLHHLGSPRLAYVASLLSLLPSSPATLWMASYTEPFFTYLSYKGMLLCAKKQWFPASLYFSSACIFRANGILLSGFLLWGLVAQPALQTKRIPFLQALYGVLLSFVVLSPFAAHQFMAYQRFCSQDQMPTPEWCSNMPPSIYSHVQSKYWNNGFLEYWTPSQAPNFLLCAPVLALLFAFSARHMQLIQPRLQSDIQKLFPFLARPKGRPISSPETPFARREITPHAIHALVLGATLLFASNTQISLRLAASMPITYWAAAWLLVEHRMWGKWWVWWSVVWGAVSVVFWFVFLPPA